jgi:hypothetical protein
LASGAALPLAGQVQVTIPKRRLLSARFDGSKLLKQWRPFPVATDRAAWDGLPGADRSAIVKEGEATLGKPYEPLPATLFLEYARNGNRSHWENVQFGRRTHLRHSVLAECVEGKGRFLDDIADGIWAICEETFWGVPAHMGAQKRGVGLPDPAEPIIELFSAETAALLAWTHYLLGPQLDKVHPLVLERLVNEVERRMLSVYRARQDFGWMGLNNDKPVNNWNPWINSNVLACTLLLEGDAARREQTVAKILTSLDRFLDSYHDDGGCDEGPGYWNRAGASLFESLDTLRSASGGALNYFDLPLVRQIGAYIYKVHIAGDWYTNFADAPAKVHPDGSLLYRYGRATGDRDLQAFGAFHFQRSGASYESLGRALPALFEAAEMRQAPAREPLVREAWLPGIQVAAARRRQDSTDGFYFAALGGHNAESHNHNDVGNFVVYLNGDPVLIDVGVETYTAKTFSPQRYEIWTMQSAFHNLPTINGVMQSAGRQYEARDVSFEATDGFAEFAADIAAAYSATAGVEKWRRRVRLDRTANMVTVSDGYTLRASGGKFEMSLMTPCTVRQDGASAVLLTDQKNRVRLAIRAAAPPEIRTEEIAITDARLRSSWGTRLYRTILAWSGVPRSGDIKLELTAG